jgi:Tfp pilus assembly protein PilW
MSEPHASLRSQAPRNIADARRKRRTLSPRLAARHANAAGFTLIELLVGMMLSIVVFTGVAEVLLSGVHDESTIANRASQLQQAELAVQRLVRNLREATSVTLTSSSALTYAMPVATGSESVTFSCSSVNETCTQTIGAVHTTEVTGVANTNIFTGTPSTGPTYIGITLSVAAKGEVDVTVTDGTGLRNITQGH